MRDIPKDILTQASRGDMQAFEKIYKETAGFVHNVAFRITSNRDDAEDVTQTVFLILYNNLKDFRFRASLKTWIYRITVNAAINFCKKRSREKKRMMAYKDSEQLNRQPGERAGDLDKTYQQERITAMLKTLNPSQRICVVLRNIEGLSYQQIAGTLKININTVRSRLKRAREALLANFRKEVVTDEL